MGVCREKGKYLKVGIWHLFNFRNLLQIIFGAAVMNWVCNLHQTVGGKWVLTNCGCLRKKGKYLKCGIGYLFNFRYLLQMMFWAAAITWVCNLHQIVGK